jgi:hypothetical protein
VVLAGCAAVFGCVRNGGISAITGSGAVVRRPTGEGRPTLAVVARDGDIVGAIAIAVTTEGIANDRGALVGASLAALVRQRMQSLGIDAVVVGGSGGWQLRATLATPADAASFVATARAALLAPVVPNDPAMAAVARGVDALAQRPLRDPALSDVARCTGEAFGVPGAHAPSAAELEQWRAAAHGLGRVAIAVAGASTFSDAAANALERTASWPRAAPIVAEPWPPTEARASVYDASGELAPGDVRIIITAKVSDPDRAVIAATALGSPHGPLASRLAALDAPGRLRTVVAVAHGDGGCLAATIDLRGRDLRSDAPARIATVAALARQELAVDLADATAPPGVGRDRTMRASDPRDAAERAAWWSLAGRRTDVAGEDARFRLVVGVASARDASERSATTWSDALVAELDRATLAWQGTVVEARTRVERGQGEAWILLASACGTDPEATGDAGTGAAVALAATEQAATAGDAVVEPLVTPDAIGVFVHGPARIGETPQALAARLADVVARAFAADTLAAEPNAKARGRLLLQASQGNARTLDVLAGALAPGHPSWIQASGTLFGLASASDDAIAMRAAAMRAGPLRVAVLANVDTAQAEAAVRAVDRWIARRPGESRVCPSIPAMAPPQAGTYVVDRPGGAPSEAILALPIPAADEPTLAVATWMAAVLDGDDGMLAQVMGAGRPEAPIARSWSATVLGIPHAPALVVRLVATDDSLDAAVAQARALLERLRHGALREADRARAGAALDRARATAWLEPRARALDLWRDRPSRAAPTLEAMQSFAASVLHDDALVIVAARPPRLGFPSASRASVAHDAKAK